MNQNHFHFYIEARITNNLTTQQNAKHKSQSEQISKQTNFEQTWNFPTRKPDDMVVCVSILRF